MTSWTRDSRSCRHGGWTGLPEQPENRPCGNDVVLAHNVATGLGSEVVGGSELLDGGRAVVEAMGPRRVVSLARLATKGIPGQGRGKVADGPLT